jgi:hypothetical protein
MMTPDKAAEAIEAGLREATGRRVREEGKAFWLLLVRRIIELQNPPLTHAALGYVLTLSAKTLLDAGMTPDQLLKLEEFGASLADESLEWASKEGTRDDSN